MLFARLPVLKREKQRHLAEEVILDVGAGGNFLSEEHTMELFREEIWAPTLTNRENYEAWEAAGAKTITQRAHDYTINLLETHVPEELSDSALAELDRLVAAKDQSFQSRLD